jgi:hypothetical protein
VILVLGAFATCGHSPESTGRSLVKLGRVRAVVENAREPDATQLLEVERACAKTQLGAEVGDFVEIASLRS